MLPLSSIFWECYHVSAFFRQLKDSPVYPTTYFKFMVNFVLRNSLSPFVVLCLGGAHTVRFKAHSGKHMVPCPTLAQVYSSHFMIFWAFWADASQHARFYQLSSLPLF